MFINPRKKSSAPASWPGYDLIHRILRPEGSCSCRNVRMPLLLVYTFAIPRVNADGFMVRLPRVCTGIQSIFGPP